MSRVSNILNIGVDVTGKNLGTLDDATRRLKSLATAVAEVASQSGNLDLAKQILGALQGDLSEAGAQGEAARVLANFIRTERQAVQVESERAAKLAQIAVATRDYATAVQHLTTEQAKHLPGSREWLDLELKRIQLLNRETAETLKLDEARRRSAASFESQAAAQLAAQARLQASRGNLSGAVGLLAVNAGDFGERDRTRLLTLQAQLERQYRAEQHRTHEQHQRELAQEEQDLLRMNRIEVRNAVLAGDHAMATQRIADAQSRVVRGSETWLVLENRRLEVERANERSMTAQAAAVDRMNRRNQGQLAGVTGQQAELLALQGNRQGAVDLIQSRIVNFPAGSREQIGLLQQQQRITNQIAAEEEKRVGLIGQMTGAMSTGLNLMLRVLGAAFLLGAAWGFVTNKVKELVFSPLIELAKQTLTVTDQFRRLEITFIGITGSLRTSRDLVRDIVHSAEGLPVTPLQAIEGVRQTAFIPSIAQQLSTPGAQRQQFTKDLLQTLSGLSIINPTQGVEGAGFAIREALANQFRSLRNRFDISPDVVAATVGKRLSDLRGDPQLTLQAITAFVNAFVGPATIEKLQNTLGTQAQRFKGVMELFLQQIGESGFFDSFVGRLRTLNDSLSQAVRSDDVTAEAAARVSSALEEFTDSILGVASSIISGLSGRNIDLVKGFNEGDAKVLLDAFASVVEGIKDMAVSIILIVDQLIGPATAAIKHFLPEFKTAAELQEELVERKAAAAKYAQQQATIDRNSTSAKLARGEAPGFGNLLEDVLGGLDSVNDSSQGFKIVGQGIIDSNTRRISEIERRLNLVNGLLLREAAPNRAARDIGLNPELLANPRVNIALARDTVANARFNESRRLIEATQGQIVAAAPQVIEGISETASLSLKFFLDITNTMRSVSDKLKTGEDQDLQTFDQVVAAYETAFTKFNNETTISAIERQKNKLNDARTVAAQLDRALEGSERAFQNGIPADAIAGLGIPEQEREQFRKNVLALATGLRSKLSDASKSIEAAVKAADVGAAADNATREQLRDVLAKIKDSPPSVQARRSIDLLDSISAAFESLGAGVEGPERARAAFLRLQGARNLPPGRQLFAAQTAFDSGVPKTEADAKNVLGAVELFVKARQELTGTSVGAAEDARQTLLAIVGQVDQAVTNQIPGFTAEGANAIKAVLGDGLRTIDRIMLDFQTRLREARRAIEDEVRKSREQVEDTGLSLAQKRAERLNTTSGEVAGLRGRFGLQGLEIATGAQRQADQIARDVLRQIEEDQRTNNGVTPAERFFSAAQRSGDVSRQAQARITANDSELGFLLDKRQVEGFAAQQKEILDLAKETGTQKEQIIIDYGQRIVELDNRLMREQDEVLRRGIIEQIRLEDEAFKRRLRLHEEFRIQSLSPAGQVAALDKRFGALQLDLGRTSLGADTGDQIPRDIFEFNRVLGQIGQRRQAQVDLHVDPKVAAAESVSQLTRLRKAYEDPQLQAALALRGIDYTEFIDSLDHAVEQVKDQFDELRRVTREFSTSVSDSFQEAFSGTLVDSITNGAKNVESILRNLSTTIVKAATDAVVRMAFIESLLNPLLNAAFGSHLPVNNLYGLSAPKGPSVPIMANGPEISGLAQGGIMVRAALGATLETASAAILNRTNTLIPMRGGGWAHTVEDGTPEAIIPMRGGGIGIRMLDRATRQEPMSFTIINAVDSVSMVGSAARRSPRTFVNPVVADARGRGLVHKVVRHVTRS